MRIDLVLDPAVRCDECGVPARVTLETDDAPSVPGFLALCHGCLILKLLDLAALATPRAATPASRGH